MRARILLVICVLAWAAGVAVADDPAPITSAAGLDRAIAQLNKPHTDPSDPARLAALGQVVATGRWKIFQVGSVFFVLPPDEDRLAQRAADAAKKATDPATVSACLNSDDGFLQFYGLWACVQVENNQLMIPPDLFPRIKHLLVKGDERVRELAAERLGPAGNDPFLNQRIERETSLSVELRLIGTFPIGHLADRMNRATVRILHKADPAVRREAMTFISSIPDSAEMFHYACDRAVLDRVLQLAGSDTETDRAGAANALKVLLSVDSDAARTALLKLAGDAESDVRWRAVFSLASQRERGDVQACFARALRDADPTVAYFAILADGPARHRDDLLRLAKSDNQQIAEWAREQIQMLDAKLKTK